MRNLFRKEPPYITIPAQTRPTPAHTNAQGDGLWVRCENERCRELLYAREFEKNLKVCHKCEHHHRLTAWERIQQVSDDGSFEERDAELLPADPLGFVAADQAYADKLLETQQQTGLREAAVAGHVMIEEQPAEMVVIDFNFLGGSMASVVGEKIVRAADRARKHGTAVVTVSSGGGARMHEGILSLLQMAKTVTALGQLGQAGFPHIAVLTNPTLGGITASYAGVGDVTIAEPGALVGFAGPRVIEQITKQKLPPDAQRAGFLLEHGMVDMVVPRRELRPLVGRLLRLYERAPGSASATSTGNGTVSRDH